MPCSRGCMNRYSATVAELFAGRRSSSITSSSVTRSKIVVELPHGVDEPWRPSTDDLVAPRPRSAAPGKPSRQRRSTRLAAAFRPLAGQRSSWTGGDGTPHAERRGLAAPRSSALRAPGPVAERHRHDSGASSRPCKRREAEVGGRSGYCKASASQVPAEKRGALAVPSPPFPVAGTADAGVVVRHPAP